MNTKENAVTFDDIKEGLRTSLIPIAGNEEMLAQVPHKNIEDMALMYKYQRDAGDSSFEPATVMSVTNSMVESLGMNNSQFMEAADEVIPLNHPPVVKDILEVLGVFDPTKEPGPLFVATTEDNFRGAGVVGYKGFLDQAAEFMNGDFIVLPSSIHEVLLLKDDGSLSPAELKDIVRSVNQTEVAPEERLSNQVYHYDSKDKVFELAEKFEQRRHEREEKPSLLGELKNNKEKKAPAKTDKTKTANREAR